MKHLPTDLDILNSIYERYYEAFASFVEGDSDRKTKIYIPIDIPAIADEMRVDSDIVFGRLYYHLNKKHGYTQDDDSKVHLFALLIGGDRHCVNFPLVASVLAELRHEKKRYRVATIIAVLSLVVSFIAIFVSLFGNDPR